MPMYNNDARSERTGHKEGGSKGKQGAHGTGKEKCSAEGGSSSSPNFKSAAEVIGAPIIGEFEVNGTSIVKGASAPSFAGPSKGGPNPKAAGGKVQKPKAAEEAGH